MNSRLVFNSASGKLGDSKLSVTDKAMSVCPVGALLPKRDGYETPIGERLYDNKPISIIGDVAANYPADKERRKGNRDE